MSEIYVDGENLDPLVLWDYVLHHAGAKNLPKIRLSPSSHARIRASEEFVSKIVRTGEAVYGVNTGFGKFAEVVIPPEKLEELQINFVRSHSCGVGEVLSREIVLAMWIIRLNVLARGNSGVRMETISHIVDALNRGFLADVPSRGSVGASGDLAPSAHASLALLGEGQATFPIDGEIVSATAKEGLLALGLQKIKLGPKEALALVNGTQLTAALAIQAVSEGKNLVRNANLSLALSVEGLQASHRFFDDRILKARTHLGAIHCGNEIREWLSGDSEIRDAHISCGQVQDPYSLRCAPQVHGAVWDDLEKSAEILRREINSSTDNPLLFPEDDTSLSGGNFHAIYAARVSDQIASALTTLASIAERRTALAMSKESNKLYPFLIKDGGFNSGFMMAHVTSAALVSECKSLSFPASVDSIPTSDDREDHVSMGPIAGFKAVQIADKVAYVLGIEMMAGAQAIDFLRPKKSSKKIDWVHARFRTEVSFLERDRNLSIDIEKAHRMVKGGALL